MHFFFFQAVLLLGILDNHSSSNTKLKVVPLAYEEVLIKDKGKFLVHYRYSNFSGEIFMLENLGDS